MTDESFLKLAELSPSPLLLTDGTGQIVFANPAATQLFELGDELRGAGELAALGITLPVGRNEWAGRVQLRTRGGHAVPCSVLARPFPGEESAGHAIAVVDLRQDESRGESARELAAIRPFETLGRLQGRIAHEYANLFQLVIGHCELLLRHLPPEIQLRRGLERLLTDSYRAAKTTAALGAYARARLHPRSREALSAVVREAMVTVGLGVPAGVVVRCRLPEPGPFVMAEPAALRRVVEELCANALKAMGEQGELDIVVDEAPDEQGVARATLEVRDTGCGMAPDMIERLSELSFAKRESWNTGLGLVLVESVVREHGGTSVIASVLGAGTTFRCSFPLAPNAP
ncbi:MAG: PAS domain-containing protein [Gemmatimonadales bacterium]|nr:PAS domain-containing protein [Gemmatimonadales bacterium]